MPAATPRRALQKDDRIFLDIAHGIEAEVASSFARTVLELGLFPVWYRGLECEDPGVTNNLISEATEELTTCYGFVQICAQVPSHSGIPAWRQAIARAASEKIFVQRYILARGGNHSSNETGGSVLSAKAFRSFEEMRDCLKRDLCNAMADG
jgi:hypothetical protein